MSEVRKRKLPARASARVEAVAKKRTSTPPREPTRPPTPAVVEDPLPKSVVPGKPLPEVATPQLDDLPDSDYQSIAESRVMAKSLERSRKKWISEGIFEKYWTKPVKRRAKDHPPVEEARNPPKESMTRIGQCTITIEPHCFDAIMYTVKDTSPKPAPPPPQPLYRPIIQYGPPNGQVPLHPPQPPAQTPPYNQQGQYTPMHMGPQSTNGTSQKPLPQSPANTYRPQQPQQLNGTPQQRHYQPNAQTPRQSPAPPPQQAKSSDPVIQMLAERAATDSDLKALMRIVADGKATPDELRKFQSHIDELTEILRKREREAAQLQMEKDRARLQHQGQMNAQGQPIQQSPMGQAPKMINTPAMQAPSPAQRPMQPSPSPQTQQRPYQPPPLYPQQPPQQQQIRSKAPPPPKPDISAVVFEFAGGNGDRYLFPKYSILEYLPGGQVIASFLIVRKGSAAGAKCYDRALDYYQPVTIRIWTSDGLSNGNGLGHNKGSAQGAKMLEALQKVVKPQEEVTAYMNEVMDNMTRAEYVLLATRLPREQRLVENKEDEHEENGEKTGQVLWNTSAYEVNGGNKKKRPKKVEKLLTEEEKYQAFIGSIAAEHS